MAIFGKKKEKEKGAAGSKDGTEGSPILDQQGGSASGSASGHNNPSAAPPLGSGNAGGGPPSSTRGPPSNGSLSQHGPKSSLGQQQQQGGISGQQQSPQSAMNGFSGPGPNPSSSGFGGPNSAPGSASGFKFGGNGGNASNGPPPSGMQNGPGPGSGMPMQQQVGGGMGNGPPPSSNNQQQSGPRSRKISEDSSGSHAGYGIAGNGLPPSSGNGLPISGGPGGGAPSSDGPSNVGGGGSSTGSSSTRPRTQQIVYPWSSRPLSLMPPRFLDETRQAPPGALSPSPFPRYGHAANSMASTNAEVYLFGGLVRESVKNDLYIINVSGVVSSSTTTSPTTSANSPPSNIINNGGVNATLVQTTGEIPPPRVGHAVVLVSNVLILWGGDTKVRADDRQDESLYLLNLSSREWTRVRSQASDSGAPNAGPVGRYGHSVSIVGSRFYVFGGQTEGMFLNDLWSFDLNSLKGTPTWEVIRPSTTDLPPRRTGHASVTYKDKIFVFGGTDGQYHYNDTWCFDVTTNSWKELSCIGYIPVPREGHAVTLVDDVMYIFGGRGVDGKELGDLASFKISNQRWYMFANMGPSPSPRSGHALTTHQNKVLVLGGENFTAGNKPDDPTVVSVLDTAKIKYPPDNGSKTPSTRKSNVPGASTAGSTQAGSRSMSPVSEEQARRAASPTQRGMNQPTNGLVGMMQNGSSQQQQQQQGSSLQQSGPSSSSTIPRAPGSTIAGGVEPPARAMSPTQQTVAQQRAAVLQGAGPAPNGIPNSSSNGQASISSVQAQAQAQRAVSPPTGASGMTYTGPRSQRSLENLRAGATSPPGPPGAMPRGINGTMERGASPASSIPAPGDAFHYGRNGSPPTTTGVNGYSKSNLAPSAELEAMRKRETWMKTALAMAQKQGFVTPEQLSLPDGTNMVSKDLPELSLEDIDTGAVGADKERIIRALVTLKSQLATAKSAMAQQAQAEVERIAEADRARSAALQEAAFCRAKVAALESNNPSEASRIERERTIQVERQMANTLRDNTELERQISTLKEQTRLEQSLRASAEDRLSDTAKRAMAAEAAQMKAYDELSALQKRSYNHESSLREHQEKVTTLSSLAARHKSDHESARSQLDGANQAVDKHLMALTQLQAGLAAATARASEHERLHFQHRDLASQHQETIVRLRNDLGARTVEAETQSKRVKDLEALVNHHRNEAEAHRSAASGSLAQLLQHNQQKIASRSAGTDGDIPSHVSDKISALETEAESLRALHSESRSLADSSTSQLQEMREKNNSLEKQHSGLRSELAAMRSQLAIALQEVARMKDLGSSKDIQLRDSTRAIEAAQIKSSLLRQFMSERGLEVPGDEELSERGGFADKRIRKLEEEIDSKTKEVQDAEHKLQESDSKVEELTRELEHKVSSMGAVGSRALGGSDSADLAAAQRRANNAERELSEATASYKERMAQLENDYQTAVQFVKGTEKMLRRMKDELTKYKTENATLQSEISSLRSGSASGANQKSRDEEASEAARDIEALRNRLVDVTQQSEEAAIENRELERRLASLITEQKEARDKSRGLEDSNTDSNKKIDEMENEINRLQDTLNNVRKELQETLRLNQHLSNELSNASKSGGGGVSGSDLNRDLNAAQSQSQQLKNENASLSQRLQETEDKVQLLLGRMESNHGDEPVRESMGYGSITSELDKWERDRNFETDPYSIGERSASPVGANGSGLQ